MVLCASLLPNDLFKPESQICGFNISLYAAPISIYSQLWLANDSICSLYDTQGKLVEWAARMCFGIGLAVKKIYEWTHTNAHSWRLLYIYIICTILLVVRHRHDGEYMRAEWPHLVSFGKVRSNLDRKRMRLRIRASGNEWAFKSYLGAACRRDLDYIHKCLVMCGRGSTCIKMRKSACWSDFPCVWRRSSVRRTRKRFFIDFVNKTRERVRLITRSHQEKNHPTPHRPQLIKATIVARI